MKILASAPMRNHLPFNLQGHRKTVQRQTLVQTTAASQTRIVTTLASKARGAVLDRPQGITTDGSNLYVANSFSHTIRRVVLATGVVTTIAGVPGINGDTDGLGRNATFSRPANITNDGTYLYVTDTHNGAVRIIE